MVSEEELKKAIIDIMKDSNDLESAKTIFEAVAIDNYYITAGRVNIVRVAMKCILEYLKNPRNLNITETRREIVKLKEIEKSHKEENGKLRVELEKKDKMIDLMLDKMVGCPGTIEHYNEVHDRLKRYFEYKAEESE